MKKGQILTRIQIPMALPGIHAKYPDMNFKDNKAMEGATRYVTLVNKESDVIDAYSTDGLIPYYDLTVLEDDKGYFLPYYGVPLVNEEFLKEYPDAREVVNNLSKHLTTEIKEKIFFNLPLIWVIYYQVIPYRTLVVQ